MDGLLGAFETWMRSWGAADSTVRERLCVVAAAAAACGGDLRTASAGMLAAWLGQERFAPWTRVSYYQHLKSFYGWGVRAGHLECDPMLMLRAPRVPKSQPRPLTEAEVERVLVGAAGNLRMWLLLGLLAGLRSFEVAKLRGEDVDEQAIYVVGKGNKAAFVPTHPDLWALAGAYPRSGWWFPGMRDPSVHVHSSSVSCIVSRHFRSVGVTGSLHRCRHTYATCLLRSGVNIRVVQSLMRHESLATTAGYTAVDEDERALAVRLLGWAA